MWAEPAAALNEAGFRTITFDLPGFGASERPMSSIAETASSVIDALERIDLNRFIFCGISMGGYVGFEMLRQRPDMFAAAVFCDTSADSDTPQKREARIKDIKRINDGEFAKVMHVYALSLISEQTKTSKPDIARQIVNSFCAAAPEAVCAALRAMANRSSSLELLESINFPVALVFGGEDPLLPAGFVLESSVRDSKMYVIEGSGHFPNIETPDLFLKNLREFLRNHRFAE